VTESLDLELLLHAARQQHSAGAAVEESAAKETTKREQLALQLEAAQVERRRLIEAEQHDVAIRLLNGEEVGASAKPRRLSKIARLTEQIDGLTAALPLLDSRIQQRKRELEEARAPFIAASLRVVVGVQESAVADARLALERLARPIAEILAADMIQRQTAGDRFSVGEGLPIPFSGLRVVEKLLAAVPDRLRPPSLEAELLRENATQLAEQILTKIKSSEQETSNGD
jgi:hypothetical protein